MSDILNLNNSTPAAPSGSVNVAWQKGASTGIDPVSGFPIYPVSASIPQMTGDTGSGGSEGLVPAPPSGSAAAGEFLKADGTFAVPPTTLPSGAANEVLATPNGASGAVSLRAIVSADLPKGSNTSFGVVQVDGTSIDASAGVISAAATPTAIQQQSFIYARDTGAANAYAVALTPVSALVEGCGVMFMALNANSGASTLALNGGSATAIVKSGSVALAGGEIAAGQIVLVVYDGTNFQLIGG